MSWIFMVKNGLKSCAFMRSSIGPFLMVAQYLAGWITDLFNKPSVSRFQILLLQKMLY